MVYERLEEAMADDSRFPPVILTVDCALLSLTPAGELGIVLIKRAKTPDAGKLALPGGYVFADRDRDLADTARRVLADKLGLDAGQFFLEQFGIVSGAQRDPRGWAASVIYFALAPAGKVKGHGELIPVDRLPPLAFDHADIIADVVGRVRSKALYSNLPGFLLPPEFTLPELQDVYERVLGQRIDQSVFRRRMDETGIIEPVEDGFRTGGRHRPAQLYRLAGGEAALQDRAVVQRSRRKQTAT